MPSRTLSSRPSSRRRIERYSFYERSVHWLAALTFVYSALTGLALFSPKLLWIASVFGGGEVLRGWHPWGGVLFSVALALMFLKWARQMRIDADDRKWLRGAHRYARHDDEGLPPSGKFNGGQKLLFWLQVLATLVLLSSGVVLWFPEATGQGLRLAAIVLHSSTAVLSMSLIVLHVYMGTAAVPGSFEAMTRGEVSEEWAREHHAKWSREVSGS